MTQQLDVVDYAHAYGSARAAWRFATPDLRRAVALALIAEAWAVFRRDAGAGEVGPAHQPRVTSTPLLFSDDPRRSGLLVWLGSHAGPDVAAAALTLARMVDASDLFGTAEQALLGAAIDAIPACGGPPGPLEQLIVGSAPTANPVLEPLRQLAAVVDRLRCHADFTEGSGAAVHLALLRGTISRIVADDPAGCWALNLALAAMPAAPLSPPGLVSRIVFRRDLDDSDIAISLVDGASAAWRGIYHQLLRLEPELARGSMRLMHLSRNARARDAWLLVAALGGCTRSQLARGLGLSRAGADIQAHALADAGLVTLESGSRVIWQHPSTSVAAAPGLDDGPLGSAIADLDASMAAVERLLGNHAT